MLGQLPELFGKEFTIGYFLPALAIASAVAGILAVFGCFSIDLSAAVDEAALQTTLALAAVWLFSVALMALNRTIVRILEGYGEFNPLQVFQSIQVEEFQSLKKEIDTLKESGDTGPEAVAKRIKLQSRMAAEYPEEAWLLPTKFGNTIRAFEVYPRVVYGLEGIQGWSRLSAVVPQDYLKAIDAAKAQVDFWVNLCVGGFGIAVFYWAVAAKTGKCPDWWLSLVAIGVCLIANAAARSAAAGWGALVRSAFDLYRGDLCKQLGLELPRSTAVEREMWTAFSKTAVYRSSKAADDLTKFRTHGSGNSNDE